MIQIEENKYFILYSCCIPVKGANRSLICDLQKNNFIYISNDVFEMFDNADSIPKLDLLNHQERNEIEALLEYLKINEMGFITSDVSKFPKIDLKLNDYPEVVKNLIIDFDTNSTHDLSLISKQISELRCSALELRFFDRISEENFLEIISYFEKSTIRTIHVCLFSDKWTSVDTLNTLCIQNKRLKQIIIHSFHKDAVKRLDIQTLIIFTKESINDESHCGKVSPYYFNTNIDFFKESLVTNNCLDGKLGIDKFGNVKLCPAFNSVFGHINEVSLKSIIVSQKYLSISKITKDEIDTCKDCEFRYICHDCRANIQDKENIYSKPKHCNYNPYNNSWN